MSKHRTTLLMAILLGLVGFYIVQSQPALPEMPVAVSSRQQLDGRNEIRKVSIERGKTGGHVVRIEYRYRGGPWPARIRVYGLQGGDSPAGQKPEGVVSVARGVHSTTTLVRRDPSSRVAYTTRMVRVEMYNMPKEQVLARKDIEYPIDWPRLPYNPEPARDKDRDIETLYREAVSEIDFSSSDSLRNARLKLEIIAQRDARFVPAYPEMARYYMKTNWGPEGLRQAERVLENGLAIDPGHANSHVLIGYVYAHQGRYKEAEAAFKRAAEIGTNNLWLWANWGELFLMQARVQDAIAMYEKALEGGRSYDTYDRARKDAYRHLIDIHRMAKEFESVDVLHRQRIADYENEPCYPYYYAKFRQRHFDDPDTVLEHAKKALAADCRHTASVRKVIGIAYYSKWLAAATPDEARSYLTQAQLFFPEGPKLIYWLAKSDTTAPVIEGLLADGISIDLPDNQGLTALAYAAKEDEVGAMKRLIALGGNPAATIGKEKIPLLAIAVLSNSKESVKCLLDSGADVDAPVYGGASMLELAEGMGYGEVAELLRNAGGKRI